MTQPNSQQVQIVAAQPSRMTIGSTGTGTGTFAASVRGMRTVALSLLVDRALSA
ncbi:hypothetical protein P0D72_06960 [Paraburkholderia sediminicola]|uniref:hypothetical protein n=1 Tax=Paraburkholderia sediminicola TaxID=458836 RepID=UPI0038BBD214